MRAHRATRAAADQRVPLPIRIADDSGHPYCASRRLVASPAVPRSLVWSLYAINVLIWSSTWVAIKIGLEDVPPLLGAGVRFAIAGAGLLLLARAARAPAADRRRPRAMLALLPFAGAYGLIYWGEQYVPSGLAAVLFGVMPLYSATIASVALADEPLSARLVAGIGVAIGGLAIAFGESLALGDAEWALLAATRVRARAAVRGDRERVDQAARRSGSTRSC